MPKTYYRCSICHSKVIFEVPGDGSDTIIRCSKVGCMLDKKRIYRCVDNYWWELLYMKIRSYIRLFINILKIIRDSWREFLASVKYYNKLERIVRKWRKK